MAITFLTSEDGNNIDNQISEAAYNPLSTKGEKLVFMGDSIFGNDETPEGIPARVAHYLQIQEGNYYNCAFGGSTAAKRPTNGKFNPFSLCNLADAICDKNFEWQISIWNQCKPVDINKDGKIDNNDYKATDLNGDGVIEDAKIEDGEFEGLNEAKPNSNTLPSNYGDKIYRLKDINFDKIDRLIITIGGNDWYHKINMKPEKGNELDTLTYVGALNYLIKRMQTNFPKLKIHLLPPPMKFKLDKTKVDSGGTTYAEDSDTYTNDNGNTVKEFAEALMKCAKDNHIPTIDIHNLPGINKYNRDIFYKDDSHFNLTGCDRVGRLIAESVKGGSSSYNFESDNGLTSEQEERISNLENTVGDFNNALDKMIELCDSYIGGELR